MTVSPPPRPAKRPTLTDVARASGVSVALASIVMRGAEGASEASRQRVKAAAAQLGYRPDSRARSLRSHRSRTIGLALALGEPLHAELADALYAEADAHGYQLLLGATGAHHNEQRAMDTLVDAGVEAIISISSSLSSAQLGQITTRVPVLSLLRRYRNHRSVLTDEAAGIEQLVTHLVDGGHRRLLHLDGGHAVAADQRRAAFERAVAQAGDAVSGLVLPAGADESSATTVLGTYLTQTAAASRATAVLAFNDRAALGARQAIIDSGLHIPGDIALTGFDDSEFARLAHVDLTSVRQDVAALAASAIAGVLATLAPDAKDETSLAIFHAPHLVVRGSSKEMTPPHRGIDP